MGSISDKVFKKIKKEQIKVKPKIYFILKAVLAALIIILISFFVLFLVSFIIFSLRASGAWFLPRFGFPGIGILIKSLPWLLILIAVILIIILEILVKRFSFAYRRPILYSVLAIILLVLLGSFFIGRTHLHPDFFWKAQEKKLPMMGGFYRGFGMPKLGDVHYGVVSDLMDDGFSLETPQGEILTVFTSSSSVVEKDDRVVVLGKRDNGAVKAFEVRGIDKQFEIFQRRPHMPMLRHK